MRLSMVAIGIALLVALTLGSTSVAQERVDLGIEELNSSGVTGSAVVEPYADGQTQTTISLIGLEPGSSHVNHIHDGTGCGSGEYSGVVETLTNIDADNVGDGTATTIVNLASEDVTDGSHVFVVHAGPTLADDPTPIACGHIPVASIAGPAPEGVSAPETGISGINQDQDGIGFVTLLAAALAAFGLASVGLSFAARRVRR